MRYSKKAYLDAVNGVASAAIMANGAKTTWSTLAAKGLNQGFLTMEQIERDLLTAYNTANDTKHTKLGQIDNSTYRGWISEFKTVFKSGAIEQLATGKPLTSVRRKVTNAKGNTTKPKASPKQSVKLADAIAAVRYYVQAAKGKADLENGLAANGDLAAMVAEIATMEKRVTKRIEEGLNKAA